MLIDLCVHWPSRVGSLKSPLLDGAADDGVSTATLTSTDGGQQLSRGSSPGGRYSAACRLVEAAIRLGYGGIAFNTDLDLSDTAAVRAHRCAIQHVNIQKLVDEIADHQRRTLAVANLSSLSVRNQCLDLSLSDLDAPAITSQTRDGGDCGDVYRGKFRQLKRITLLVTNVNQIAAVNNISRTLPQYDVVAVTPIDLKTWQCVAGSADADLISLDLRDGRLAFPLKRTMLGLAVSRGMFFEVQLSALLADSTTRRNTLSNLAPLLRFVPHHRIIFTSEARQPLDMRAPHDIHNLAGLLGVSSNGVEGLMGANVVGCLYRGAARRSGGYVTAVPVDASVPVAPATMNTTTTGSFSPQQTQTQAQAQKQSQSAKTPRPRKTDRCGKRRPAQRLPAVQSSSGPDEESEETDDDVAMA